MHYPKYMVNNILSQYLINTTSILLLCGFLGPMVLIKI